MLMIGNSVTNLGDNAFSYCIGPTSLYFTRNAPSADSSVFLFTRATAYYLAGTTGWAAFSASTGVPCVLWNPMIQTAHGNFGVHTNKFGFTIIGTANIPMLVQATSNLSSSAWTPLQSCTLTNGSIYFADPAWTNYRNRFYSITFP